MLQDGYYISLSSEPELYPYLLSKIAKYMPPQSELKYAKIISNYYTFRITEYATKDSQFLYLIEDWLDVYAEKLEKYEEDATVMLIHDNTRFPAKTWEGMLDALYKEFKRVVGGDKLTAVSTAGFSPKMWVMSEADYTTVKLPEIPPRVKILVNGNEHEIEWDATKETVYISMPSLTREYYRELDQRGYKRVEE